MKVEKLKFKVVMPRSFWYIYIYNQILLVSGFQILLHGSKQIKRWIIGCMLDAIRGYTVCPVSGITTKCRPRLLGLLATQTLSIIRQNNNMPKCPRLVVAGGNKVGKTAIIEQAVYGNHSPGKVGTLFLKHSPFKCFFIAKFLY